MELAQAVAGARKPWADHVDERYFDKERWWYTCKPKEDPRILYKDVYEMLMANKDGIEAREITKKLKIGKCKLNHIIDSLCVVVNIWEEEEYFITQDGNKSKKPIITYGVQHD